MPVEAAFKFTQLQCGLTATRTAAATCTVGLGLINDHAIVAQGLTLGAGGGFSQRLCMILNAL